MENQTVEIIKAAGDTSIGILPVVAGAIVTLIGLCLHVAVRRYWRSPKEELCLAGENPEGNVDDPPASRTRLPVGRDALLNDLGAVENLATNEKVQTFMNWFPLLPWCTKDLLA